MLFEIRVKHCKSLIYSNPGAFTGSNPVSRTIRFPFTLQFRFEFTAA
jgi:hypothetical protein